MTDINLIKKRWELILDKVNSPYFTDEEFEEFINMACLSFINKHAKNFESTDKSTQDFDKLLKEIRVDSDDVGVVLDTDIETELGTPFMYIENVSCKKSCGNYGLIRFCRHNDYYKMVENTFKKPTDSKPVFRIMNDSIFISPAKKWKVKITVMKQPLPVSVLNNVGLEFDERASMKIISIALELAGIAVDETELYQMANAEEQKLG